MEDQRKKIVGVHHRAWGELRVVVASVAVTILLVVALILLLLVDPLDDVCMVILGRFFSAFASAPRARRVLRT